MSEVPTVEPKSQASSGTARYADPHWDELAKCESGGRWDTVDPSPNGYDGGLGIYVKTWLAFGGAEFAPMPGYATREQQITVGSASTRRCGWDPWGCANNVLHWPQWSM